MNSETCTDQTKVILPLDAQQRTDFEAGLTALLEKLGTYSDLANVLGIKYPYEKERGLLTHLRDYLTEGACELDYGALRHIKSGVLLNIQNRERKLDELKKDRFIPQRLLDAAHEEITRLTSLAEQGQFNGLRPADISLELMPDNHGSKPTG